MKAVTPQPIEDAIALQLDHFDNLIRHAQTLGFDDDVQHWRSERAAYVAEMQDHPIRTEGNR